MKKPNYTPKCFSIDSNSSHCVLSMKMICSCRLWLLQAPKKCRMIGMDRQPKMGGYFLGGCIPIIGGFHKWGYPKWIIYMEKNTTKMDDLGVPLFQETPNKVVNTC